MLIVVDDGWAAAPSWERRAAYVRTALKSATRAGRLVALAPTSQGGLELAALDAPRGEDRLRALAPVPYAPQRLATLPPIAHFLAANPQTEIVWIADGVEFGGATEFARALADAARGHKLSVVLDKTTAIGVAGADNLAGALQAHLTRAGPDGRRAGTVRALDAQGRPIGEAPFNFGLGRATDAKFDLPVELRNEISRLAVADEPSAGATWLVDERSRRRRVAILSGASADVAQPLLSPAYYVKRALAPYAEIREGGEAGSDTIESLLAEKPSVLALADMSVPPGPAHDKLAAFVESGGVLLRFAGTRLAAGDDDLTPTALRRGGRTLGGALSWETPKHIAAFDKESPFFGLAAPDEVTVSRQVLAEPEPGLAGKTWARLADGTPLVTAAPRGKGLIVLFHVTADTTWSNLPLSGLFVDMLRRIVARAGPAPASRAPPRRRATEATRAPYRTLDGFGALGAPPAEAAPIGADFAGPATRAIRPASTAPPTRSKRSTPWRRARRSPRRLRRCGDRRRRTRRRRTARPQAVAAARRPHRLPRRRPRQPVARPPAALRPPGRRGADRHRRARRGGDLRAEARAADAAISARDADAARQTHLAYVETGDATVDETTRLGLESLARVLGERTSAQIDEPITINPRARRPELLSAALFANPSPDGRSRRPLRSSVSRRS